MNHKTLHESSLSIAASILLGSIIIAGSIAWSASPRTQAVPVAAGAAQAANGQQQPSQPAPAAQSDISKLVTSGEAMIGNPAAKITIAYWYDYQCPFCKQNELQTMPSIISDYVNLGKVRIVFKDFAFLGPDSTKLALTARAVWEAAPQQFLAWHDAMFQAQGQEGSGWATDALINQVTTKVLGASGAAKVQTLLKANAARYQKQIDADKAEGQAFGVQGTPGFVIGSKNGSKLIVGAQPYSNIKAAIDSL
ncbi:MAG TPA: thioredoxin domain-containing protein [Candidatus Paceibacterota bacterium]|nr:thioredoxin domain-containing protein [Candidatus Paceibacterota bacterium]